MADESRAVGFYGKLPSRGDFISRNLPRSFTDPWDAWLQQGMSHSKATLGDQWLAVFLESPLWRFALAPGVCGDAPWAGILLPSVDKVGRYFPFAIARAIDSIDPLEVAIGNQVWMEALEAAALAALGDDAADPDQLLKSLAETTGPSEPPSEAQAAPRPPALPQTPEGVWSAPLSAAHAASEAAGALARHLLGAHKPQHTLWWSSGSNLVSSCLTVCEGLPAEDRFDFLLTGGSSVPEPSLEDSTSDRAHPLPGPPAPSPAGANPGTSEEAAPENPPKPGDSSPG